MAPATSKQLEQPTSSLAEIAADRQREFEFPSNVIHPNNKAASQTSNDSHEGQTALLVDVDGDGDGSVCSSPGPRTCRSSDGTCQIPVAATTGLDGGGAAGGILSWGGRNESSLNTDLELLARAKRLSLGAAALESRGDPSGHDMLISGTYAVHSRLRITPLISQRSDVYLSPSTSAGSLSHSTAGSPKKNLQIRRPGSATAGSPTKFYQSRAGSADLLAHVQAAAETQRRSHGERQGESLDGSPRGKDRGEGLEAVQGRGQGTKYRTGRYGKDSPLLETRDDLTAAVRSRRKERRVTDDFANLVELVRLREANVRLEAEVSRLRDKSDRLEGERRRLSARLAAVHTAMQQLEREAAIRSRTRAEATMGAQQKGWNRWFSGDPSAMERVLETAEDARVERAAAAATVEKLVEENARLVQQMNEQKLLIANLVTTMRTTTIPGTPAGVPASSQGMHAGLSPVLTQPLPAHATSAAGRTSAAAAAVVEDNSPSSSSAHSQLSFPTSSLSTPPASSHELPFTGRSAAAALAALPVRATSASEYTLTADVAGLGSVDQAALAGGVGGTQGRVPVAQMSQNVQDESSRSPSPRPTALHPSAPFPAATNGGSYTATEQAFPVARDGGFQTATGTASGAAREDSRDSHGTFLTANGPSAFLQSAHSSSSSLAADASLLLPVVRSAPPPSAALCAQQPTPTLSESSSRYPAIWPVTYSERELEGAGGGGGEGGVEGGGGAVALTVGNGTVGDVRARGMVDEAGSVVAAGSGAGGVGLVGAGEIAVRGAGGVERNEVSLIDSPLVGAPFRLAFFLVKVVSKTGIVQRLAGRLVGGRNKDLGAGGETQNVNVDGGVGSSVGML